MKLIKNIVIATLLFVVSSCADSFLSETLPNQFEVNQFYRTDEEAVKGLYGLYTNVRSLVFGRDYTSLTDLMCDDLDFNGTDQARRALNNFTFDNRNRYFSDVWTKFYQIIGTANIVIDQVLQMERPTIVSEQNANMIIAEAKFIRSWAYYQLVQLWGKVPLVLEPVYDFRKDDIRPVRAEVDSVYVQILRDLKDAEILHDTPHQIIIGEDITYKMTITRSAVKLMQAKTYLLMEEYASCIEAVEYLVIDRFNKDGSGRFALLDNFFLIFDVAQKGNPLRKKEVIWEIEAKSVVGFNNTSHREFAPSPSILDVQTTGYLNFIPSTSLFEAFSKQPSDRRYTSIYRISGTKPCIMKKIDYITSDQNTGGNGEILLRFADAILIYAEALNAIGEIEEAAKWINLIRERAGLIRVIGPVLTGDIKPSIGQQRMQDTIISERRMEFAHEGHRLFDLRRSGKLESAMQKYNADIDKYTKLGNFTFPTSREITMSSQTATSLPVPFVEIRKVVDPRILLHPIPGDELHSNPNLLPNNPGY